MKVLKKLGLVSIAVLMAAQGMSPAHADINLTEKDRPATLTCTADVQGFLPEGRELLIVNVDTSQPRLVDMDAGTDDVNFTASTLEIVAHNGCDNFYDLVFFNSDLLRLKEGKVASVRGMVNFFNGDGIEGTAVLTCR